MAALQYVHVPGYRALLMRRTYQDLALPGALMDRAAEWLRGTGALWQPMDKKWIFPSGATLSFGYLQAEADKVRYQGAELSFIGVDELSQWSESAYRYMFSRIRRLKSVDVPMRMRAASNPGAQWVKERFEINAGRPESLQMTADGRRAFVPARLIDNPALDSEEYKEMLSELDPVTRRQLLEGDWDVRPEGKLFKREWFQIVEAGPA